MALYTDPQKRHDFVLLFDVTNGNPNGDPDAGNMPRIDPETGHGFVTDVAIKRKIRDYVALAEGKEIFIQSKAALNTLCYKVMRDKQITLPEVSINDKDFFDWLTDELSDIFDIDEQEQKVIWSSDLRTKKEILEYLKEEYDGEIPDQYKKKLDELAQNIASAVKNIKMTRADKEKLQEAMVKKYYDVRMFGAVLTVGTNAGQVRGPVQITFAKSIDPIFPLDVSITRVAITRESDAPKKQTEMGRKPIVPYGLYRAHGFYNPNLAARLTTEGNPIDDKDLNLLWSALANMFEQDRSAARGEMTTRGLYIFSHSDEKGLGNAPAHKLFNRISVDRKNKTKPARSIDDYQVTVSKEPLPDGIEYHDWFE